MKEQVESFLDFLALVFVIGTWLAGVVIATGWAKLWAMFPPVAWYFLVELLLKKEGLIP